MDAKDAFFPGLHKDPLLKAGGKQSFNATNVVL
jgi:hypothetical protein